MPEDRTSAETSSISDTAAEWCLRLHAPDLRPDERAAFERWYASDPRHRAEYDVIQHVWHIAGDLRPSVLARTPAVRKGNRWRRLATAACIAAGLFLAGWGAGWSAGWLPAGLDYHPSREERRTIALPDGSEVELNLRTALFFAGYRDRRNVTVSTGEAFFRVAQDPGRPFRVATDSGSVVAEGTAFNVWADEAGLIVTLVEGRVLVTPPEGPDAPAPLRLEPGMQARLTRAGRAFQVAHVDPLAATAWRDGKLVLGDTTLGEVLPLINRYLARPIRAGDQAVESMRIGGIYNIADIEKLPDALTRILPLTVERTGDAIILTARRSRP